MCSYAEIGALMVQVYELFVSIGYVTEDEICWPPHSNARFLEDEYRSNGIEENAIELMRHLPWPKAFRDRGTVELFYRAVPPCSARQITLKALVIPSYPSSSLKTTVSYPAT